MSAPIKDPIGEAARVIASADAAGLELRLTGGVGIASISPSALKPPLKREYGDIDFVAHRRDVKELERLFGELGYVPELEFNTLHGERRLFFIDQENKREADVFLENVEACHELELGGRLGIAPVTIPCADLLLSKLQVVETTPKDYQDALALLLDHELTEDDGPEGISLRRLEKVCCDDWGWWKTVSTVAVATVEMAERLSASGQIPTVAGERLRRVIDRLETAPKSRRWKLRARIGERVRWHEEPEDLDHVYS